MRRVAFLRSINVGGRRVTNAELVAIFTDLGLADVAAYQAAGNLVFTGEISEQALASGLSEALGYPVPAMCRTLEEVAAIAGASPFSEAEHAASSGKVQVTLLAESPSPEAAASVLALQTEADRLRIEGRTLYWLPAAGLSTSALDTALIFRTLGMQTTRTQGTLQRLVKKFG